MRKVLVLLLILPVLLLAAAPPALADWPGADQVQKIDALVAQVMRESRIPGMAVGIVEGDQVVYLKGFGTAGGDRTVTAETPFILGSLSKSFTAMAVMQQVEAGKLNLDAPVQQYLPWFRLADAEASARITVRHLLNQTSGIPRAADNALGVYDDRTSAELIVRQLASVQPWTTQRERFQYSNYNYITAGLIVETVAGLPFDQYVSQRILAPLRMNHAFTNEEAAIADGLATGHLYYGTFPIANRAKYSRGRLAEGYMIASASDMTRYLRAMLRGGTLEGATVLPPARLTEMLTPPVRMAAGTPAYSMGWMVSGAGSAQLWEHDGETPTFRSAMRVLPGDDRALIILANASSDPTQGVSRLAGALTALLRDQEPMLAPAHVPFRTYVETFLPPALLLWQGWDLFSLRRWGRRARARGVRWVDWALPVLSLAVGLLFLIGIPVAYDATLALMWAVFPQETAVIFGTGLLAVGALVYRVAIMLTLRGRRRSVGLRQHADTGR